MQIEAQKKTKKNEGVELGRKSSKFVENRITSTNGGSHETMWQANLLTSMLALASKEVGKKLNEAKMNRSKSCLSIEEIILCHERIKNPC